MGRLLEMTIAYVQTRQAFRRPIGAFQALQHRLADMLLRTESTRSAVYRAAWCLDTNDAEAGLACAAAKAYAGDASRLVCGEAIQMHGGIGFTWGARPALLLQAREDARAALRLDGEPARAGARGDGVLRCVLIRRVQPTATLKGL